MSKDLTIFLMKFDNFVRSEGTQLGHCTIGILQKNVSKLKIIIYTEKN